MVIDYAASVTFYFGSLIHCISLPLLNEGHVKPSSLLAIGAGCAMDGPCESSSRVLDSTNFFYVLVVSHEEGVVLLIFQAFVALVVGLAHE